MLIDLYALPDAGAARRLGTIEAPWLSMVHDFIATDRHLVLFVGPVKLVLWRAMLGLADFGKLFRWCPDLGARMIVVPLDNVDNPKTFELEPFWAWHFANAFEDGNGISIDVCRYNDFSSLEDIGGESDDSLPTFMRVHLDLATGQSQWQARCEEAVEFPQVHANVHGAKHKTVFAQTRGTAGDGVSRIDESGRLSTWNVSPDQAVSEPVLVPRSDAEDDVWVLDLVLDRASGTSHVAVLDGRRLPDGPVAKVHFDHAVPITFHGVFAP